MQSYFCLLYTSDAADERSSVDLGGRRIIKKKKTKIQKKKLERNRTIQIQKQKQHTKATIAERTKYTNCH